VSSEGATGPMGATAPAGSSHSQIPPAPKRTASGQHPAVVGYRRKLESIADGVMEESARVDRVLEDYLQEIRTPPPPRDDDDGGGGDGT
jgi:hypothetical protein